MFENLANDSQQEVMPSRRETTRVLDTAVGILVGWRRCSTHSAFRELITASDRHNVPIFGLAAALVSLASRGVTNQSAGAAAQQAAEREWGLNQLL